MINGTLRAADRRDLAAELLARVGLPSDAVDRYPHQFSAGQRQRICIARALSVRPALIVADEAVSALDLSVARQITVMLVGRIVETGPTAAALDDPRHPYTLRLLGAAPVPDPGRRRSRALPIVVEPPSLALQTGQMPEPWPLHELGPSHFVAEPSIVAEAPVTCAA